MPAFPTVYWFIDLQRSTRPVTLPSRNLPSTFENAFLQEFVLAIGGWGGVRLPLQPSESPRGTIDRKLTHWRGQFAISFTTLYEQLALLVFKFTFGISFRDKQRCIWCRKRCLSEIIFLLLKVQLHYFLLRHRLLLQAQWGSGVVSMLKV